MSRHDETLSAEDLFEDAEALIAAGDTEEAEKILREVIAKNPGFSYAYRLIATIRGSQGRYDDALRALDVCIRNDPTFAQAHYLAAKYLYRSGKIGDAHAELDKAIRIDPHSRLYKAAKKNLIQ
ncbi:MAG: tetratricopeptide repeat protein [Spirochaetota bacterium]